MATLADELLNDFDDSGSEVDEQNHNGLLEDDSHNKKDDAHRNGDASSTTGLEVDGNEEDLSNEEKELMNQNNATVLGDAPDEEETKSRVEKMKLGGVSDIRNVAGLMKTLQPVLEVRMSSFSFPFPSLLASETIAFTSRSNNRPDLAASSAENRVLPIYPSRREDYYNRIHRRQSRVQVAHAVQLPIHLHRCRNHSRA
jgi:hypothetical protein